MADIIIENPKKSKKWLWVLLIIFIIIIALGVFYYFWKIADKTARPSGNNTEIIISAQLPKDLPDNLPIEDQAVLQTKEMGYEGGVLWEVSYLSTQSIDKLSNDFAKYISDNDWVLVNDQKSLDSYFLFATKDTESLNVNISVVKELEGQVFVVIAYTKAQ